MGKWKQLQVKMDTNEDRVKLTISMLGMSVLLLGIAFLAYYFAVLRRFDVWFGLFPVSFRLRDLIVLLLGCAGLPLLLLIFMRLAPSKEHFYAEAVELLAKGFSIKMLFVLFVINAFSEEMLFRGALQVWLGILPAAVLFTAVHVSYYKKPWILLQVFCTGLALGLIFQWTESVWICAVCHFFYNFFTTLLIKTGKMEYGKKALS